MKTVWRFPGLTLLLLVVGIGAATAAEPEKGPPPTAVRVEVDTSDAPELNEYGKKVKAVAEEWYPKIAELLPSDGFTPPDHVTIVFRKDYKGVAAAGGDRIVCAVKWFTDHPEDVGAIVHELAHVVQQYPGGRKPGWLVEGIADHVRFFHYEPPEGRPHPNPDRAKYTDSYRTTAAFLEWAQATHDPKLVIKLNAACRERRYTDEIWKELTGKTADELGEDWKASLRKGK